MAWRAIRSIAFAAADDPAGLAGGAAKAEAALEEVKKDFDTYREEKCAHEKMLSETLESTRTELSESR